MKDYSHIEVDFYNNKYYYDDKNKLHRLIGPAKEWFDNKYYFLKGSCYMIYFPLKNNVYLFSSITNKTFYKYHKYIKQNIKDLMNNYELEFKLGYGVKNEKLPDFIKDLLII